MQVGPAVVLGGQEGAAGLNFSSYANVPGPGADRTCGSGVDPPDGDVPGPVGPGEQVAGRGDGEGVAVPGAQPSQVRVGRASGRARAAAARVPELAGHFGRGTQLAGQPGRVGQGGQGVEPRPGRAAPDGRPPWWICDRNSLSLVSRSATRWR